MVNMVGGVSQQQWFKAFAGIFACLPECLLALGRPWTVARPTDAFCKQQTGSPSSGSPSSG